MANLYCRVCNGDGMVPVVYGNHELKELYRSLRCCALCNRHDTPKYFTNVIVDESEIENLRSLGYRFRVTGNEKAAA